MYLYMSHISPILEIIEISVALFSTILEILEIEVSIIPRVLEIRASSGRAEERGRLQRLCSAALDYCWDPVPGILQHVQSEKIRCLYV